eukprot:TRINITY_DN3302_c0_g1_i1.p1 TRINITY_DN3302_c0_g1~~TRINITY_DN3302_c0_g1_i1.p1  ORF type:complete len:333 (-),score=48.98 TRINITY_DN3302_c0_g1_i1:54-1052(-)
MIQTLQSKNLILFSLGSLACLSTFILYWFKKTKPTPSLTNKEEKTKKDFQTLPLLLQNKRGLRFFEKYLIRTYCSETLSCYLKLQERKTTLNPEAKQKIQKEIIERFCTTGSDEEVNVSELMKKQICEETENLDELYNRFETELYRMLEFNSWTSFKDSPEYKACVQEKTPTMNYIECPDEFDEIGPSIFLAGGISNCTDWQSYVSKEIQKILPSLVVLNPRRSNFDLLDTNMTKQQITWEFKHLRKSTAILFWFPSESICPIALYELGTWTILAQQTNTKIFIGCDQFYTRKEDLIIQTQLANPSILPIVESLESLIAQVKDWYLGQEFDG